MAALEPPPDSALRARDTLSYEQAGVNYDLIDPLKVAAQRAAAATAAHLPGHGFSEVAGVARRVGLRRRRRPVLPRQHRRVPGLQGAGRRRDGRAHRPELLRRHRPGHDRDGDQRPDHRRRHAAGRAGLLGRRRQRLVRRRAARRRRWSPAGRRACDTCGVAWGGGETPALAGIVEDGRIDLAAVVHRHRQPEERGCRSATTCGAGDAIVLLASSGIHANGLSLARKLVERLPKAT